MACLIAPTAAAVIMTATRKKIMPRYHIEWLLALLWGGSIWLMIEHIYHGEVVLYPPFFTAGFHSIVSEVLKVGVPMTIAAFALWLTMLATTRLSKNSYFRPRFDYLMVIGALVMVLVDKIL